MLMTTIPRRHIYEVLLELEDTILEIQALIFNEEYYNKYTKIFNTNKIENLKKNFFEIIATLPLFLNNSKFEKREEFENEINYFLKNQNEAMKIIKKNLNISKKQTNLIFKIVKTLKNLKIINSLKEAKEIYSYLDEFDNIIPKILELRRDHMK